MDKQPADLLAGYDVVEFIGGNPYYLLHSIRQNNAAEILKDIATNKILIGWSAAAFVFSPTLELVNCYSAEMNFLGLTDLNALSLTQVLKALAYSDIKEKITDEKRKQLEMLNVVSGDENAYWLIDYWCGKDVKGLIQMPFSRHWIMHIEACLKIRDKQLSIK